MKSLYKISVGIAKWFEQHLEKHVPVHTINSRVHRQVNSDFSNEKSQENQPVIEEIPPNPDGNYKCPVCGQCFDAILKHCKYCDHHCDVSLKECPKCGRPTYHSSRTKTLKKRRPVPKVEDTEFLRPRGRKPGPESPQNWKRFKEATDQVVPIIEYLKGIPALDSFHQHAAVDTVNALITQLVRIRDAIIDNSDPVLQLAGTTRPEQEAPTAGEG